MKTNHVERIAVRADDELLGLSAARLAAGIRRRELSPVEVVRAHIERAQRADARVHALAYQRFDAALREARAAEQQVMRRRDCGPLHGVPCTLKEGLGFAGLPKTSGSTLRRGYVAKKDSTVVARIRAAGAIVIGLTNQSEMALWPAADNLVYGRTENPWRSGRSAGGSSGGEAAIVAAGASAFGLGTDGGGSIRIPAAYCGVFGHKPSSGTAPLSGHLPLDERFGSRPGSQAMARYFAPGPIVRRAEDLMPVLRAIAGPDGIDRNIAARVLRDPSAALIDGRRVLVCDTPALGRCRCVAAAAAAAVRRAAMALEQLGAIVVPWTDPLLARAFDIWASILDACDGPSLQQMIGDGSPPALLREAGRRVAGRPDHTLAAWLTCVSERWLSPAPATRRRRRHDGLVLAQRLRQALGPDCLLLLPPVYGEAPGHYHALLHPLDIGLSALFNALELPATVAPVSTGVHGLPLSVQIVGPHGGDHLTMSAALGLEQVLGGWRGPAM